MGVEGRVTVKEEEANLLRAEFKGPNMGVLIGRRGQTLIQYSILRAGTKQEISG